MYKHGMGWRHRVKDIENCDWGIYIFVGYLFIKKYK